MIKYTRTHRGVSDVIATLLMVAIAAIGGTAVFGVSQGFFNENQPALPAAMEKITLVGFDATDAANRTTHQGTIVKDAGLKNTGTGTMEKGDKVFVYLLNPGLNPVGIQTLTFAGEQYGYQASDSCTSLDKIDAAGPSTEVPERSNFAIVLNGTDVDCKKIAEIPSGKEITLVISNEDAIKIGRDAQIKILTAKGTVIAHKIQLGLLQEK